MSKILKLKIWSRREETSWVCPKCNKTIGVRVTHSHSPVWSQSLNVLVDYREDNIPYRIAVVPDNEAVEFLKNPDVTEISEQEANSIGKKHRPRVTKIANEHKVIKILAKVASGVDLMGSERKAIDENDPEPGINKTKEFDVRDYL